MPKIKRNTHEIEIGKEEDIEIRGRQLPASISKTVTH